MKLDIGFETRQVLHRNFFHFEAPSGGSPESQFPEIEALRRLIETEADSEKRTIPFVDGALRDPQFEVVCVVIERGVDERERGKALPEGQNRGFIATALRRFDPNPTRCPNLFGAGAGAGCGSIRTKADCRPAPA